MEFPGADALAVFAALVALAVLTFVGVAYRGTIGWQESLLVSAGVIVTVALCVLGSGLVWRR
ncbi:MAG: hypothetical protein QME70_01090 [Bacillota bacterium]|nr:hypothetical protein [Bacillota bacterium]